MATPNDPIQLFQQWFAEAGKGADSDDYTAAALATTDPEGLPDVRMVLVKNFDARGFCFYTNLTSPKAQHLAVHPHAAICFHWPALERQVRIRGPVESVAPDEADAYFASRERYSQLGAWASKQSQPLQNRYELEKRTAYYATRYGLGTVPRPEFWSGFRLIPARIEFWIKRPYRLHDRVVYTRQGSAWERTPLFP